VTIGASIKKLLEERKRVILPGFGNLEISESESGISPSAKRIDPPGVSIRFDSSYSKDDGLLASAISEGGEVDLDEATQQVLELVDAIRFALDKGESYVLEEAGTFTRDDDGKIRFRAAKDWVISPDQFGLESMDLLELEDQVPDQVPDQAAKEEEKEATSPEKPAEPVRITKPSFQPPKQEVRPKHEPWKKEKQKPHRKTRLWRIIWSVAGVLIIVLIVLIALPEEKLQLLDRQEVKDQPSAEGRDVDSRDASSDTRTEETETTGEECGTPAPEPEVTRPVEEPVAETPAVPVPRENTFFLVVGSFKNLANASELQDNLTERGYKAEVIITENRMYRVSAASYPSREEAERGLIHLKKVPGMENSWLLHND
jgi:cell division septation protein DedD